MKKIYLDQKDYSKIARGMTGISDYQRDVEIYNELLKKVNSSEIRIYFSFCHMIEALKYHIEGSTFLDNYCEVIDSLTRGHCLLTIDK